MSVSAATVKTSILGLLLPAILCCAARGDEFQDLSASFGTTLRLVGGHQPTTSNPDGTAINFWTAAFEGAPANSVALPNPHMAQADAYGNVYIADKASHAITSSGPWSSMVSPTSLPTAPW